jgi:hypothetical protein
MPLNEDKRPVLFSKADAMRLQRMLREHERGYRNEPPQRGRQGGRGGGLRYAKTTTTVTARSGSTIGTGSVELYHLVGAVLTVDDPTLSITVKNAFGTSVASGMWVIVEFISGEWGLVAADCA